MLKDYVVRPDFLKYPNGVSQAKQEPKVIVEKKCFIKALKQKFPNLSFTQNDMSTGLGNVYQAGWDMTEPEQADWREEVAKRIRTLCRHAQMNYQKRSPPRWFAEAFSESPADSQATLSMPGSTESTAGAPTESTTAAPTESTTAASVESTTAASESTAEAPTESTAAAPTESTTGAPTEATTGAPTEATTAASTESTTLASTEPWPPYVVAYDEDMDFAYRMPYGNKKRKAKEYTSDIFYHADAKDEDAAVARFPDGMEYELPDYTVADAN